MSEIIHEKYLGSKRRK